MSLDVAGLYQRYGPMVLRRCRQLLNDEEKAVDAMQDVFVRLLENQQRLQDNGLSSLLYTMATNVCLNIIRSHKRKPTQALESDETLLDRIAHCAEPEDGVSATRMLDLIFKRHPTSTRTIATLHLHDGFTLEETAEAVGLSVSGVRKRLRVLQQQVKELGLYDEP